MSRPAEMQTTSRTIMKLIYTPPRVIAFQSIFPQSLFPDRNCSKIMMSEVYFDGYYIGCVEKQMGEHSNNMWYPYNGYGSSKKSHYPNLLEPKYLQSKEKHENIRDAAKAICLHHLKHHAQLCSEEYNTGGKNPQLDADLAECYKVWTAQIKMVEQESFEAFEYHPHYIARVD